MTKICFPPSALIRRQLILGLGSWEALSIYWICEWKCAHLGSQGHPGSRITHVQALKTVQAREIRTFRPRRPEEILSFRPARPSRLEKYALSGLEGPPDQRNMHTQRQKALTKLTAAALRSTHLDLSVFNLGSCIDVLN